MNGYRILILHDDSDLGTVRTRDGSGDNLWPGDDPVDAVERLANKFAWYKGDEFYVGSIPGEDPLDYIRVKVVSRAGSRHPLEAVLVNPECVG